MTTAIRAGGLSKRFDRGAPVLDGVELTAVAATVTLVLGPPGSGRSTLVRCLTGVYRPDYGDVTLRLACGGDVDLTAADPRTVAWVRAQHIASFDGALAVAPSLTVLAAVARASRRSPTSAATGLARLGVGELAALPVGRLRSGERLTVALAAALLTRRPFVVLDEPEKYADPRTLTGRLHRATAAGAAVVVTGAHGSALTSIASAIGELRKGRIAWHKP